jgi:CHASE2 domain-containing sensor protein
LSTFQGSLSVAFQEIFTLLFLGFWLLLLLTLATSLRVLGHIVVVIVVIIILFLLVP